MLIALLHPPSPHLGPFITLKEGQHDINEWNWANQTLLCSRLMLLVMVMVIWHS